MKPVSVVPRPFSASQQNSLTEREQITSRLRAAPDQDGREITPSHGLDNGDAPLQSLQRQVADLEQQIEKKTAKDDIAAAPGAFSDELQKHRTAQARYEKKATADLFGNKIWVRTRQRQLATTPGGKLAAAQYGIGFAHDEISGKAPFGKLDINHGTNGYYQRLALGADITSLGHALYHHRYPNAPVQARHFLNSRFMATEVLKAFKAANPGHGALKSEEVAPGIHSITCTNNEDWEALDKTIGKMGARVSSYQLVRAITAAQGNLVPATPHPKANNLEEVAILRATHPQAILSQLRQIPAQSGTHALARCDAEMIEDLAKMIALPRFAQHQHNPVVAQGLRGMRFIAETMPALATDSTRFGNAHRALMEEMHIVLNEVKPYSLPIFKISASERIRRSLPTEAAAKMLPPAPCLTTSGVQSLRLGLQSAFSNSKGGLAPLTNKDKSTPFYYETQEQLATLNAPHGKDRQKNQGFYTTLADSYVYHHKEAQHSWSLDDIMAGIEKQIASRPNQREPLNVVIDTTVENAQDIKALMTRFGPALADNQLRLFMCKSHQKFANLGCSKVSGGSITLLGAKTNENKSIQQNLRDFESQQGWFNNDESQLLTHLTRAAVRHEPAMLQTAIDNGNFIASHCFHGKDGHTRFDGHQAKKPFAMLHTWHNEPESRWPGLRFRTDKTVDVAIRPEALINRDLVRLRGSFAFTDSNMGDINDLPGYNDKMTRLSFGQENKAELIERFWMVSRERQLDKEPLTSQAALELAGRLADNALTSAQRQATRNQPLSEKLRLAGQNEATPLTDVQRNQASVTELRGTLATPQAFTVNKVASIIAYLNYALTQTQKLHDLSRSDDRPALDDLLRALIESGMPGVSRTGREQAVGLQCALCYADMCSDDAEKRRTGVDNLLTALQKSSVSHNLGMFKYAIPDKAWQEQTPAMKEKLINAVFDALDDDGKLAFLNLNIQQRQGLHFVQDCAIKMAGELRKTSPEESRQHWQATIKQEMLRRNIISPPAAAR